MSEIVVMLNSKLPMELVNKILYEFKGLQSPVAIYVTQEIAHVHTPDPVDWIKLRFKLYYERLMSGQLSSWNANQMVARLARDLLADIDAGGNYPFWDPECHTPGETISEVCMRVLRMCHLPQLPLDMDPDLTFEDRVNRIRLIVDRKNYNISESMIRSLAQFEPGQPNYYQLMRQYWQPSQANTVLSRILTLHPYSYKPYLNSKLDYPRSG